MPKYRVYAIYTAAKLLGEFEAENENEAESKAHEQGDTYSTLCHQCADEIELGDDPYEFQIEEI